MWAIRTSFLQYRHLHSCAYGLLLALLGGCSSPALYSHVPIEYEGSSFRDALHPVAPQKIPGKVYCALYDIGDEGVACHDTTPTNLGSGGLNPANGSYLNEFRMNEPVDISYVKFFDEIDNNPYDKVQPPDKMFYVGWTDPGEWINLTVDVAEEGTYAIDLLYTSHQGGSIGLDLNGQALCGPLAIESTATPADPLAWRQWHHWNLAKDLARVKLPKGVSVLTVRVLTEGQMNLGYLDFRAVK